MTNNPFTATAGNLPGAIKDGRNITADWIIFQDFIEGVKLKEIKNVLKMGGGKLTEVFRADWQLDNLGVDQVFQNVLPPGSITGWHAHQFATDRLFVNAGSANVVLYDARSESSTFGKINEFSIGSDRPALVVVPNGVWHVVQNPSNHECLLLNLVDKSYKYEDPDHRRLPLDTNQIPYTFVGQGPADPNL